MRVLALTRYGPEGASSRVRLLQYLPALDAAGIHVDVMPFFAPDYVPGFYGGRVPVGSVVRSYFKRLQTLLSAGRPDVIWLEKEVLPWIPWFLERRVLPEDRPLLVDYDDAVFHRYDMHRSGVMRKMLGGKIDGVMARADCVTVGNDYLAERARAAGARSVEWLPTVVDIRKYALEPREIREDGRITVGWIGSPATAPFLRLVADAMQQVAQRTTIRCVAIGARPDQVAGTSFESWPWSEGREATLVRQFDIGIMPLPDSPFERGKCGYKLIQYMASRLPVVASPVGVNCALVTPEVGFLASSRDDWVGAVETLAGNASLRERLGSAGRRLVEHTYSLHSQAPRFATILRRLGGS